ncbi:putative cutinase 3 [Venturia nashicola]|uniref:cutinase n=1 Tax=Venturia nashicola TaxID=86259 RepID=A0A4Z1P2N4_9PEZI|nr:putative cutinase 3 [Venturia nashicola]TLD35105.1 putative cutinase 3 [Venturia nashicola]
MRLFDIAALFGLASALPNPLPLPQAVATGENSTGTLFGAITSLIPTLSLKTNDPHDLTQGAQCKPIYFLMARGSREWGTVGVTIGPPVCKGLKDIYGEKLGCDGLGPAYSGGLLDNVSEKGTTDAAITEGVKIFAFAHTKCPDSVLLFGGYSQGAAVMHNVISSLPPEIHDQIAGGILWGDTKNQQSDGMIKGFPKEKVLILCTPDDGVCWGKLDVTAGHLAYTHNGDEARSVQWLKGRIDGFKGKAGGGAPAVATKPVVSRGEE